MDATIFFRTINGSFYMYDMQQSILLNTHPIIEYIYLRRKQSPDENRLIESLKNDHPEHSFEEISYYIQKYKFLNESGFFKTLDTEEMISGIITPEIVEKDIANLDNILFQVTGDCNLSCKYCCYGDMYSDESAKIPMDKNKVDKILSFMHPYWNSSKNLSYNNPIQIGFYGGEPLLNFSLVSYIISCCEKLETQNISFIYSITTNGILLDKYMDFIVEKNISVLISLDGNKTHNQLRVNRKGENSFEKVYKNAKELQKKYPDYFNEKVNFNAVLNKYSTAQEIHTFIKKEFGKTPLMEAISTHQLELEKMKEFGELYQPYTESHNLIKERMEKSSLFIDLSFFFYYLLNNSYKHYVDMIYGMTKQNKKIPTGTCLPFYKKMFISSDGKILACERVGLHYVLGTITDQVNLDYKRIADLYTQYLTHIKKQCEQCYLIGSCGQCLFQLPTQNNKFHHCPNIHDKKAYQIYLGRLFGNLEKMPELFENVNKMVSA